MGKLKKIDYKLQCNSFHGHREYIKAVLSKDPKYDDKFLFGDRKAGYYCRPTCGKYTKLNRESIKEEKTIERIEKDFTWFENQGEAEIYGFKPCGRCFKTQSPILRHNKIKYRALVHYSKWKKRLKWSNIIFEEDSSKFHNCRDFKTKEGLSFGEWLKEFKDEGKHTQRIIQQ